ncbi:hypothetical protein VUR80DRAFT_679 [Thermomyces stellatus]
MCHGDITQLICGHTLQQVIPCQDSSTKNPCVITWERHTIRDTCAPCDPKYRMRQLRDEYEARHATIMGQMLEARRRGNECAVAELSRLATRLYSCHQERVREVLELERKIGREGTQ